MPAYPWSGSWSTDLKSNLNLTRALVSVNLLHPNISMHILHTVLYTFPKVLTRRIFLII